MILLHWQWPMRHRLRTYMGDTIRFSRHRRSLIHLAAEAVVGLLRRDEGVLVHCVGGTGRTGTVIGCALRLPDVPA